MKIGITPIFTKLGSKGPAPSKMPCDQPVRPGHDAGAGEIVGGALKRPT